MPEEATSRDPPSSTFPKNAGIERPTKRQKIAIACDPCRSRKVKCDGIRPVCGVCTRRKTNGLSSSCSYGDDKEGMPLASRWRSQASEMYHSHPSSSAAVQSFHSTTPRSGNFRVFEIERGSGTLPQHGTPPDDRSLYHGHGAVSPGASHRGGPSDESKGIDSMTGVIGDQTHGFGFFGSSSAGSFMRQIKSAIDAKVGSASRRMSFSGKLTSPPLSSSQTARTNGGHVRSVEYILPSRRAADDLMSVYWGRVHPLYPFLDPYTFQKAYESVWTGSTPLAEERIIMCTLNVLFALSCQLSDSMNPEDRDESARSYFKRAQALLQLDLWDIGSPELIQCLLLMGQYLQSTSSPHQCWMVIGNAIRIAQGLGFHLPEPKLSVQSKRERQSSRIIWHGCVLMDRVLSMTFGRPPMIAKSLADAVPLPETNDFEGGELQLNNQQSKMAFFVESLRLYNIMNDILLELYTSFEESSTKDQHSKNNQQSDYESIDMATILKFDHDLMQWGRSLPPHLRISSPESAENITVQMQSVVCRARFLHARILLLRPALSQFCLFENAPPVAGTALDESLGHRMVFQCSSLCVRAAHDMIQLIHSNLNPRDLTGPLPAWWYCILYVYTAATVLLAGRLQPRLNADITNYSNRTSWDHAIQALKSFGRLGQSAQRCVAALEILSAKVPTTDTVGNAATLSTQQEPEFGSSDPKNFPEADLGEYADADFSGLEMDLSDMSWLNILPGNLY